MTFGELVLSDDVEVAEWIRPRLGGRFGAVTRTLPSGYQAYAPICNPATDSEGAPVNWTAVAAVTGRRAHLLTQWHALVGSLYPVNVTSALRPRRTPGIKRLRRPWRPRTHLRAPE